jgi:hypothetical protein
MKTGSRDAIDRCAVCGRGYAQARRARQSRRRGIDLVKMSGAEPPLKDSMPSSAGRSLTAYYATRRKRIAPA